MILHRRLPHYLDQPLSQQLSALYFFIALQDFAQAMVMLFEPVYLHHLGYSIGHIGLFYALVYAVYIFLIPLGGLLVNRFGPSRSIAVSTIFLVGYYLALVSIPHFSALFVLAPILFALQKTLYWPGFHTDFIRASRTGERGREFSGLYAISMAMFVIGPVIGGLLVTWFGYTTLFMSGATIIFFASLPLLFVPVKPLVQKLRYRQLFSMPWSKKHRRTTLSYIGFGESLLQMYIWPIFLAAAFMTSARIGLILTLSTLVTALVTLMIGKSFDRGHWRKSLFGSAGLAFVNWVVRPFISGPIAIFGSAIVGQISQNTIWVTASDVSYARALDENDDIGRPMILEQGLAYGKVLAGVALALLASVLPPFSATFILGAIFSLMYFLFR